MTQTAAHPTPTQSGGDPVYTDILTLLRTRASLGPDRIAIEDVAGPVYSYATLLERVEGLAAQFLSRHGKAGRPRLGIVMPNGAALSETLLAASVIGAALPFNPAYTEHEFEYYFAHTDIDLILSTTSFAPAARRAAARVGLEILDVDSLTPRAAQPHLPLPNPADTALVLFTSGSTGRPKRVPLSHHNVCTSARDVSHSLGLTAADRCLSMWELFHVGGLVDLLLAPLHSGGTVIATSGFEAANFFDLLEQRKPTWFQAVPTALTEIVLQGQRSGFTNEDVSLRFLRSVAAALSPALLAETESLFAVPVITTFGMTEASPLVASTGFDPADRVSGSVGRSCGTEIGIFDGNWQRQPTDTEGEVAIRGPNLFSGYEADPAANAAAFCKGWFRTGDLGHIDLEGRLFLTGRIKELVNRGGEKVNLREVDDALLTHPAILEAATFPVPHRTLGEDVAAAIVLRPGAQLSESDLRSALAARLVAFKIPRRITILPALPRNVVGKIDRKKLVADAAEIALNAPNAIPESELESCIAAVWARELGLTAVGPLDDFVRLGGDSLAALRVMMAVEANTGLSLPDDTLSQIRTVRDMAASLVPADSSRGRGTLLTSDSVTADQLRQIRAVIAKGTVPALRDGALFKTINLTGSRKPLIWFFNRPAEEMLALKENFPANRPLYGGFSGGRIFDMSDAMMDRLARLYTVELLSEFPEGDFTLGGNCKGARLAWDVTRHLRAAGREVERLCLVEYAHPDLAAFDRPILMLFGKQSRRRAYRDIHWGKSGWDEDFSHRPVAAWIDGAHGEFFHGHSNKGFLSLLTAFLDGRTITEGTLVTRVARRILHLHGNPLTFALYRAACRLSVQFGFAYTDPSRSRVRSDL